MKNKKLEKIVREVLTASTGAVLYCGGCTLFRESVKQEQRMPVAEYNNRMESIKYGKIELANLGYTTEKEAIN